MRIFLLLILLFTLCSCIEKKRKSFSNEETTYEVFQGENELDQHVLIGGYPFKSKEANKLNSEGMKYVKQNELHTADKYFTDALSIEPDNPVILCNIGNLYREWGKDKIAIDYYRDALIKSDSTYFNAAYNMGISYCNINEYEKSEKILNSILIKTTNETELFLTKYVLIRVFVNQGKCFKANELYNEIKPNLDKFSEFEMNIKKLEIKLKDCMLS